MLIKKKIINTPANYSDWFDELSETQQKDVLIGLSEAITMKQYHMSKLLKKSSIMD